MARDPSWTFDEDEDIPRESVRADALSAWVLVFGAGLMLGCTSLFWLFYGRLFNSGIITAVTGTSTGIVESIFPGSVKVAQLMTRLAGISGLTASILVMAIASTSYREGRRWAWYMMWCLPLYSALEIGVLLAYGGLTPGAALWNIAFLLLALSGLFIPYKAFFGEERTAAT